MPVALLISLYSERKLVKVEFYLNTRKFNDKMYDMVLMQW